MQHVPFDHSAPYGSFSAQEGFGAPVRILLLKLDAGLPKRIGKLDHMLRAG
jgi:hypothetical protein